MAYDKTQYEEKVITDLKELGFEGNPVELDLNEDAWEFSAPPPAGLYKLKLFLAKDGLMVVQADKKDPLSKYVKIGIEGRIKSDDADIDNIPVFANVTSRVGKRKAISTMAGLVVKLGYGEKIPKPTTDAFIAKLMLAVLKKEPIVDVELDWKASYKYTNAKGEEEWVNVYNHYNEFPKAFQEAGKFSITGKDKMSHEIRPMLFIAKWFGKGETPTLSNNPALGGVGGGSPVFAAPAKVQDDAPVFASAAVASAPAPVLVSQPRGSMPVAPSDDDLMLE